MIHYHTKQLFEKYVPEGADVIQAGDQWMNIDETLNYEHHHIQAHDYYRNRQIISLDIHGENGAEPFDLSTPFPNNAFLGTADAVTDFGTLEHVKDLGVALKHFFDFCKVGGVMLHANPKTGHFPNHNAYHYFTQTFWEKYAKAAGLELLETREQAAYHNEKTGVEVYAVLRKTEESKFPTKINLQKVLKYVQSE